MTAVEFDKKRKFFAVLSAWLMIFTPITGIFLGAAGYFKFFAEHVSFWNLGCAMFFCALIFAAIVFFALDRWRKRFISRHPEMRYLNEWISIMGSAEKYPIHLEGGILVLMEVEKKLEESAMFVSHCLDARDEIVRSINKQQTNTVGRSIMEDSLERLACTTERAEQEYGREWTLFVDHLCILSGAIYTDPKAYRESLLKKA